LTKLLIEINGHKIIWCDVKLKMMNSTDTLVLLMKINLNEKIQKGRKRFQEVTVEWPSTYIKFIWLKMLLTWLTFVKKLTSKSKQMLVKKDLRSFIGMMNRKGYGHYWSCTRLWRQLCRTLRHLRRLTRTGD
jgi:hypothetical protein